MLASLAPVICAVKTETQSRITGFRLKRKRMGAGDSPVRKNILERTIKVVYV
jgi:hypothetical protein